MLKNNQDKNDTGVMMMMMMMMMMMNCFRGMVERRRTLSIISSQNQF